MGSVVALYQISIALSSVCLLTKKRGVWYFSLVLGVLATALLVAILNG